MSIWTYNIPLLLALHILYPEIRTYATNVSQVHAHGPILKCGFYNSFRFPYQIRITRSKSICTAYQRLVQHGQLHICWVTWQHKSWTHFITTIENENSTVFLYISRLQSKL